MSTETLVGVWQREFEEDPIGDSENADRDTLVWWVQSPKSGIYVDIRLPKGSPGRLEADQNKHPNPSALQGRGIDASHLTKEQAEIILRQKSFAGVLQYSIGDATSGEALAGDKVLAELASKASSENGALELCTCFWKREIDYQPPGEQLDIGVCASAKPNEDGSIDLRETGNDASYAEGWHRLLGTNQSPSFACKLVSENDIPRVGYWVRTGARFAYAVGRPTSAPEAEKLGCAEDSVQIKDCVGKTLAESVTSITSPDDVTSQLRMSGSYVGVAGEITESGDWVIRYSIDPALVGCQLVGQGPSSCSTCVALAEAGLFSQKLVLDGPVRKWQIVEHSGTFELPGMLL